MENIDFGEFVKEVNRRILGNEVEKECAKHGKYIGYDKFDDDCDKCSEEREEIEHKKQLAEHIDDCVAQTGLPTKYHKVSFDDWISKNETMENAKQKAIGFANMEIKRMLMIGTCGTGKTMLAACIIRQIYENKGGRIVYTTVPRLIRDIRDSWSKYDDYGRKISEQEAMDYYINADVLIVDELGAGRCTEDDKLIFSEILCDRYSEDLPTLLISNLDAEAIKARVLDERAADRMREDGVFVVMNWESMRKAK